MITTVQHRFATLWIALHSSTNLANVVAVWFTAAKATPPGLKSSARPTINRPTKTCSIRQRLLPRHDEQVKRGTGLTDQPEQPEYTAKHLHDQNLHKQVRVRSVCERSGGAGDTNRDAAEQVARADSDPSPEDGEAGEVVLACVEQRVGHLRELGRVYDADDDAVDSHDFAEDDATSEGSAVLEVVMRAAVAHLIRFLVRIRGALTPPPRMDEPVMNMPLWTS